MEAIIYAAGIGKRLEGASGGQPKILLEIGGKSLLEWHLVRLAESGVSRLTLVTGFERGAVEAAVRRLDGRYPVSVEMKVNDRFTEGSALSFEASVSVLETLREPVLLMDADVLYPAAMLRRLVRSGHRTALLVDREYSTADDDPVLVPVAGGRPFDFVKRWSGEAEWVGESVGFFKVAPEELGRLISETRRVSAGKPCGASYDDVLRVLVQAGRFGLEEVTGMPWTEMDFPGDVDRARREVFPAVMGFGE